MSKRKPDITITQAPGGTAIVASLKFTATSIQGYGKTEEEAIESLMKTLEEINHYSSDRGDYNIRRVGG